VRCAIGVAVKIEDFDFSLPQELIAQHPTSARDGSRLLRVERHTGQIEHRLFRELPSILRNGDLLVMNDSRVIPARLIGKKRQTGGRAELLLVRPASEMSAREALALAPPAEPWVCLGQAAKSLKVGNILEFEGDLRAEIVEAVGGGEVLVQFSSDELTLDAAVYRAGRLPLPPYIDREPSLDDAARYQTVYATQAGSVAAPTAGLHFTEATLNALTGAGVQLAKVTLEVGPGTFLPIRDGDIENHRMHKERCEISESTAALIRQAQREGRRVVAVGTTVLRTLEAFAEPSGELQAGVRHTQIFIKPGYTFRVVEGLLTNFHLPRSTLLMLVSALLGVDRTLQIYAEAVAQRYRFYSFGDAMLIERSS
jgi:S-adenosylmethionine:tRNA ribosyltransferase-isomerase